MQRPSASPLSPSPRQRGREGRSWDVEADISVLFSKHSVEQVRQIEQKTRLDIERKKEELRQMVGERYRDLIDAADSIMDLHTGSKQVGESLSHLIEVSRSLQQTHFVRGLGGMRGPPQRNETHEITAQMKLLGDSPEKIWHCLEQQEYLEATRLFLLARHTHSQMQVSLAKNSLLQRLWRSTAGFKSTILDCCRLHLRSVDQTESAVLSSLSSIVLLEGCSLRQVFSQFLLAQKVAIQAVFHPNKQMHCSVKAQLSEAVSVIRQSITLIASLFCIQPGQVSSPLLQAINTFTLNQKQGGVRVSVSEVSSSDVQASCLEWLTACVSDVRQGVQPLLYHVTSVRGLSGIRTAIHLLLAQPERGDTTPISSTDHPLSSTPGSSTEREGEREGSSNGGTWSEKWRRISEMVTGDRICLWQLFLQQLFFERAEAILTKQFTVAEEHAMGMLLQLLEGVNSDTERYSHDIDVTSQLWTEEPLSGGGSRGREGGGRRVEPINTLSLKTKACTPAVYSLCLGVAEKLKVIVEDVGHYLLPQPPHRHSTPSTTLGEEFPFRLHDDHSRMQEFLQLSTVQCIKRFLTRVQGVSERLRKELEAEQNHLSSTTADRLLLVARVCRALSEFCSPLALLSHGLNTSPTTPAFRSKVRSQRMPKRKEGDAESDTVQQLLSHQCSYIHRVWAEWSAGQLVAAYRDQLHSSSELSTLSSSLVWDEIAIVEEAESGKQVTSVIRVPSQASVYVTSLLFAACQELSRIGGHIMERGVLQHFCGKCLRGVLEVHRALLTSDPGGSPMHQNCALQLLFNVRFLCSVLSSPKDMEEGNAKLQQSVIDGLQAHIDPFDLDVFTPHLLSALERQLQRSTVLLGLLLALRGSSHHFLLSTQKPKPSSAQERHIVIPLFPSTPRFSSLPVVNPSKPLLSQHEQGKDADAQVPKTFLETVAFFHHM